MLTGQGELHAPDLILLETANALRGLERSQSLDPTDVHKAVGLLRLLDIRRHPHDELLDDVWALRHNLTSYDASYLAVAMQQNMPLATADSGLATVARKKLGARRVTLLG